MTIKAIETVYKGYRFRSRLEARWAVFFDAANIEWKYEIEGYETENGERYLPDFYLPDFDCHVEVKPNDKTRFENDLNKCEKMIYWGGPIKQILILAEVPEGKSIDGGMWHFPVLFWDCSLLSVGWGWWYFHNVDGEDGRDYVTGEISRAQYVNARYWCKEKRQSINAVSDAVLRNESWPYKALCRWDNEELIGCQERGNYLVFQALKKARQARFEHGDCGVKK